MAYRLLIPAFFLLTFSVGTAQRVFTKIDPAEIDDTLKFDTNTVPVSSSVMEINASSSGKMVDLNFSPNIVFAPDSSKGFVSYSGSTKVMVFRPQDGEILGFAEVGDNPGQLTLTPDGKTVVVTSLYLKRNLPQTGGPFQGEQVGAISSIDVETLEVKTLELSEVFLSFANNVVFSADSKTGFVASSRTDEMLRFDLETMTEIEPRLGFTPGTRPSAVTMSPDRSLMAVVLVGSTNLSRFDHPDSVTFVDSNTFTIVKTVAPKTGPNTDNVVIHDFTAVTNFAFTRDGKYGVIADQQFSAVSMIPELSSDRAWVLDFETDEFIGFVSVGGIAAGSFTGPDGYLVIVGALDVTVINPELETSMRFSPYRSDFRPTSRPAFSADGRRMFLAAPLKDSVVVFNLKSGEMTHFVEIGGEVARGEVKLSSAPLDLSMTPDGLVLASVNFNANTVELMRDTERFFVPNAISNDEFFTGIALTNTASEDAEILVKGYGNGGIPFFDDSTTEEVVEFVNPNLFDLPAGSQLARSSEELLEASPGSVANGWLEFDSDVFGIRGLFLTLDHSVKRLDGTVPQTLTARRWILPEARVDSEMNTEITILNPNLKVESFTVSLHDFAGEELAKVDQQIPPKSFIRGLLRDVDPEDDTADTGIFPLATFENFEGGYVLVEADLGVLASQRYFDSNRMSSLNGFSGFAEEDGPRVHYIAQVAAFQGSDTFVTMVNGIPRVEAEEGEEVEQDDLIVQLTLKDGQGLPIVAPVQVTLSPSQALRQSVVDLFGLTDEGQMVAGWIEIESDGPGLVADAEIQLFSGKAMTTLPYQNEPFTKMTFSHFAEGLGYSTGLVLINPGSNTATVTVRLSDSEGTEKFSTQVQLEPGHRRSALLTEYFEELVEQVGGFITVESDEAILGYEAFYTTDLEVVSSVLPQ